MENKKIGAYTIVRLLGSGGMGQVYEAVHDQIQRRAAIKVLHKRYANNRQIAQRFINEARATNIVQHPSLVSIYEFGQAADGSAYIVMEYLDGDTLRQRLERHGGRLPPQMAMRLCRQIASALSAAHQKGIVHRDLKPVNIMIVPDPEAAGGERAKVLDFGLAKVMLPDADSEQAGLTHTGTILGTPAYMAPEQCRSARAVDDKSDVYSLGVILFEMLSSDIPFDAETDAELLSMHMYKEPPSLLQRAPDVLPELAELVARMLAKEQVDRPSAADVASSLARLWGVGSALSPAGAISSSVPAVGAPPAALRSPSAPTLQVGSHERETLLDAKAAVPALARSPQLPAPQPAPLTPPKRGGLGIVVAGLLLVLLAAAGGALLGWQRGRKEAGPTLPETATPADGGMAGAGAAAVPSIVHWSLGSIPAGAQVVGADDQALGVTPLTLEGRRGVGTATFVVRLPGYGEARVALPLDRDDAQVVTLVALPAAPAPATKDAGVAAPLGSASPPPLPTPKLPPPPVPVAAPLPTPAPAPTPSPSLPTVPPPAPEAPVDLATSAASSPDAN